MKGDTPMMAGHPPTQREIEKENEGFETTELHMAAFLGQINRARKLLMFEEPVDALDQNSETPLLVAVQQGHAEMAELLIANDADVNARTKLGETPLMLAAGRAELEVLDVLLHWSADVTAVDSKGQTALHHAALGKAADAARRLLENRAALDAQDAFGATALHRAISKQDEELVGILLETGAQVLLTPWDGRSVFHLAAEKVQPGMLRRLLPLVTAQQLEALPDSQGNNALHAAASSGCAESVALLLEKGMYVDSPGMLGWTALHFAVRGRHLELARFLLTQGAKPNIAAADGSSVAMYLRQNAHRVGVSQMVEALREFLPAPKDVIQ